jgi:DNA-binding transcriptional MerR regulator
MYLKMSRLAELTQTPKSTILYYIKEGLLPEPEKIKPNVHLYSEDFVERIKFIKYLQSNFHASISQIKALIERGDFDFSHGFESVLDTLDLLMEPADPARFTAEELCEEFGIEKEELGRYVREGAIFEREGGFSKKEAEILSTIIRLRRLDADERLLECYIEHAREVAESETKLAKRLLDHAEDKNDTVKTLFDAALVLKPYIFNMHLVHSYRRKEEGE